MKICFLCFNVYGFLLLKFTYKKNHHMISEETSIFPRNTRIMIFIKKKKKISENRKGKNHAHTLIRVC